MIEKREAMGYEFDHGTPEARNKYTEEVIKRTRNTIMNLAVIVLIFQVSYTSRSMEQMLNKERREAQANWHDLLFDSLINLNTT